MGVICIWWRCIRKRPRAQATPSWLFFRHHGALLALSLTINLFGQDKNTTMQMTIITFLNLSKPIRAVGASFLCLKFALPRLLYFFFFSIRTTKRVCFEQVDDIFSFC